MRSGKLLAINDLLIEELVNDSNYLINADGTILTLVNPNGSGISSNYRNLYLKDHNGYKSISYKNKKLSVHRIIYRKFVGNLEPDLCINHKDGNPSNNIPSNLELVSASENNIHRFRTLGNKPVIGNTVINFDIADEIRTKKKQGLTHKQLCLEYGLSKGHISEIVNNKIWIRD